MKKENEVIELLGMQAELMRHAANNIDVIAKKMMDDNDLARVADAMTEIYNLFPSLRLDLMITKSLRELEKRHR